MTRYLVACDAGGTMTDVIIVDEGGQFVIGKAPTTPQDESIGYMESFREALSYWGIDPREDGRQVASNAVTAIYTGTGMLNALLNMSGLKTGLIVTRGFEEILTIGRGCQTIIGCDWSEIVHMQYRKHGTPPVPKKLTYGVTERIDLFGQEVIPLYEHEVRAAARKLLDKGVEAIAIVFLYSFANPTHEQRAAEIVREVMRETGRTVPLVLSSEVAPMVREVSRANATVVQAYAAEPARKQLFSVEAKLAEEGYRHSLKTVLCYGGVTNIRYPRLFETVMSGPVGGMMGAHYLARAIGVDNVVCSDMGGTSFDAGAITAGTLPINREPPFMKMYVNVPMLDIRSIGAGTGTYVRLDPETNRIKLGPDSAGGTPGPVFQETGNETPTIGDCDLILGIINPDYYLGGRVKVNKEKALRVFKAQIADPLGLDVYEAAEQCVNLINVMMREHLVRSIMLGHDLRDYVLLGYGGAGPMHLAGFAGDAPWKGVATVKYAAAFSAWGCACMDYAHRRHRTVSAAIPFGADTNTKMFAASVVNSAWEELERQLIEELQAEGFARDQISLRRITYMRFVRQLDDLEVEWPQGRLASEEDVDRLIAMFQEIYAAAYTGVAAPPEASYLVNEVAVVAQVDTVKPTITRRELEGEEPPKEAFKGTRPVYQQGRWHEAKLYEMERLRPGNQISGVAVIEAPSTTLFLPPGWKARLDEHEVIWLERGGR